MNEDKFDPFLLCGPGGPGKRDFKARRIIKNTDGIPIGFETYSPVIPINENNAMTKYFKRGTREYYQVTPERLIRIVNKEVVNEVTIVQLNHVVHDVLQHKMPKQCLAIFMSDTEEAKEIDRSEFEKEFLIASRLIVLEP